MVADLSGPAELQTYCRQRAYYSYGTGRIFERRALSLQKRRQWITYLGIAVPLLFGATLRAMGTGALQYILIPAGMISAVQLALSAWSLVARWDEKYAYAMTAFLANTRLFNTWDAAAQRPPADLDKRVELLRADYERQEQADLTQLISPQEKRYAMHATLYHYGLACERCKIKPTSMVFRIPLGGRMRLIWVLTFAAVISCVAQAGHTQERPRRPPQSAEIAITGTLSTITPEVGEPVLVFISLRNVAAADASLIEIAVPPFSVTAADDKPLTGIVIPARRTINRVLRIAPLTAGRIPVIVQLKAAGYDQPPLPIGVLEVARPYAWLLNYAAIGVPILIALATSGISILLQFRTLRATREQKASEAVIRIITEQGRDYYFSVSGALKELVTTLEALQRHSDVAEQEHLRRRAFFFFGMFLYKEHEFSFSHGYLYLGHLWSEATVRRLINDIAGIIRMSAADEAVVHKCFSDRWHFRDGSHESVTFRVRTLYDVEQVLLGRETDPVDAGQRLREVYSRVAPQFSVGEVLRRLAERAQAMRSIIEYEFTKLFEDWYEGDKGTRGLPRRAPADFDEIVGAGSWQRTRDLMNQVESDSRSARGTGKE